MGSLCNYVLAGVAVGGYFAILVVCIIGMAGGWGS